MRKGIDLFLNLVVLVGYMEHYGRTACDQLDDYDKGFKASLRSLKQYCSWCLLLQPAAILIRPTVRVIAKNGWIFATGKPMVLYLDRIYCIHSFNLFSHAMFIVYVFTWWHLRSHQRLLILTMLTSGRTGRCHPGIHLHKSSWTPPDCTRHHHSTWSGPGKLSCAVVVVGLLLAVVADLSTAASPHWSADSDLASDWSEALDLASDWSAKFSPAACAPTRFASRRCRSACPQWSWPPPPRPWSHPGSEAASGTPGSPPTRWWASWPAGTCWSSEGSCWWGSSLPALSDDCHLILLAQLHSDPGAEHFSSTSLWERREVCRKQFRCFDLLLSSAGSISLTWIFGEAWKWCCVRLNQ